MIDPDAWICKYCGKSTKDIHGKLIQSDLAESGFVKEIPKEITANDFYHIMLDYQEKQTNYLESIKNSVSTFMLILVVSILIEIFAAIFH
jgi:ABC-type maltose transport system permease subunit